MANLNFAEHQITLKKHPKSSCISLKINCQGKISLTIPRHVSLEKALKFLYEKKLWLDNKVAGLSLNKDLPGIINIFGQEFKVIISDELDSSFMIENQTIFLFSKLTNPKLLLKQLIIKKFKKEITILVAQFAEKISVKYNNIKIADNVSNFGSCSSKGNLSFSWRLAMMPINVIHYVIIHELCHLIELNHSAKFWKLVAQFKPDFLADKKWLKQNGNYILRLL